MEPLIAAMSAKAGSSLSVHASLVKCGSGFDGWTAGFLGGEWARSGRGVVWCARAPSLISVHEPGWFRVGDMMVEEVIPLVKALRPLQITPAVAWELAG